MIDKSLKKQWLDDTQQKICWKYLKLIAITIFSFYVVFGIAGYVDYYASGKQINGNLFPLNILYGFGPNDPECFELGTCDLFGAPFDAMMKPFDAVFQGFTLVIVWGIIIGILWLRVSNPMMVAVVGVALAALFARPDPTNPSVLLGFPESAQAIGWGLLILAIGVAFYQIIVVRVHFPTN